MRIGLLTNPNPIFGTQLLEAFTKSKIKIHLTIVDKKLTSAKDIDIHNERTNKKYKVENLFNENYKVKNLHFVENHNSDDTIYLIKRAKLDFLINGFTPRILNEQVIKSTPFGVMNCHPGILPHFRGCMAVEWSIFYNKPVGNTIHWMTKKIDEGPIINKKISNIKNKQNYQDIRTQVHLDGINLLVQTINQCILKKIDLTGVSQKKGSYFKPMSASEFDQVIKKIEKNKFFEEFQR